MQRGGLGSLTRDEELRRKAKGKWGKGKGERGKGKGERGKGKGERQFNYDSRLS
jgi:hypothetical protein